MATRGRSAGATRWLTPDEESAWRGLLRMQARLAAHLSREMSSGDLSLQDYGVLVHLSEAPGGRMRAYELGDELGWEKSRLSHHVARMVDRGLVARERCPSDQRGLYIAITPGGRRALTAAAPAHVEAVRRAFIEPLTDDQLAALSGIAEAILGALSPACSDEGGPAVCEVSPGPALRAPDGRAPSSGRDRLGGSRRAGRS